VKFLPVRKHHCSIWSADPSLPSLRHLRSEFA
jgi:hypothetical protein